LRPADLGFDGRMAQQTLLVTGSSGLIGSEVVSELAKDFARVFGLDNNMRANFFGQLGDTRWRQHELLEKFSHFTHRELDIRDRVGILKLFEQIRPTHIVHAAAQPSHDLASQMPFDDFDTNAVGTLNLLEATRRFNKDAVFVYLSSNKVYGDAPNRLELKESDTRWDYASPEYSDGISENFNIDQSKHSLFGASKVAADVMVQEYGRYYSIPTCCLRGSCLTGPNHSGVELHGFLSYLAKCNIEDKKYTIYGYKGKQVRDNIHAYDVAMFIRAFFSAPRVAEVYNLGGGRANSVSILEAFDKVEQLSGKKMIYEYTDKNREGDHICYISNLAKMVDHYREWKITKSIDTIFEECCISWVQRLKRIS
jgi:CDP-paratose 2-epimerase